MIRPVRLVAAAVGLALLAAAPAADAVKPQPQPLPVYPVTVLNAHGDVAYDVPGAAFVTFDCVIRDAGSYQPTYSTLPLPAAGVWVYGTNGVPGDGASVAGVVQCQGRAYTTSGPARKPRTTQVGYLAYWEFTP